MKYNILALMFRLFLGYSDNQNICGGQISHWVAAKAITLLRWFIGDFTLTPQYFASSLSVNCHDSQFHRLPTMKFASTVY